MILSDKTIKKLVEEENLITPFNEKNLSSNSYDLTLAEDQERLELMPGESRLVVTEEKVNLPADVVAKTVSKSSFARCGVSIGDIGGWVDAGYRGQLTLLAVNLGDKPFELRRIKEICQIIFLQADSKAEKTYNGHYQDSKGLKEAWFINDRKNFNNVDVQTAIVDISGGNSNLVDPDFFEKRCDF